MTCGSIDDVHRQLVELDERANLDTLPEVQAMRLIVRRKPEFDRDAIATFCVAAALNDYQEAIPANPDKGSYWGRFVDWAVRGAQGDPPWRRFPVRKSHRFNRFRESGLWNARLLEMDSAQVLAQLSRVMRQSPADKTICFAPLVLARWAHVIQQDFVVVPDHPLPMDSRITRLLQSIPELDAHKVIEQANVARRNAGRRVLTMSDFDAWAWQSYV